MSKKSDKKWNAILDENKCSLCEVCANKCPTGAITLGFKEKDRVEELVFDYRLCDNCGGEPICQISCPEEAIFIKSADSQKLSAPVVIFQSEIFHCLDCGMAFAPGKKIETIQEKENVGERDVQSYCPNCRRRRIMEKYSGQLSE